MKINIIEPKTKDEVDVPLENMKFVEKVPDSIRVIFFESEFIAIWFKLSFTIAT